MMGCLKTIPDYVHWCEEFEFSHDAPQAPNIDEAGRQSGQMGFLLAPWNSPKKYVDIRGRRTHKTYYLPLYRYAFLCDRGLPSTVYGIVRLSNMTIEWVEYSTVSAL